MNYRRIVVPVGQAFLCVLVVLEVITNLDIDTWKETERNQGMAKCRESKRLGAWKCEVISPGMRISSGWPLSLHLSLKRCSSLVPVVCKRHEKCWYAE